MASKNTEAKNNKKSNSGVDAGTQELPPMLALVQKAATLDSNPSMKQAAEITLKIFQKVQSVKEHRSSSQRLAEDVVGLIARIWKAYQKLPADEKQNWPPKNDIAELVSKLVPFLAIVEEQQVKRSKPERVWTNLTDSDSGKIRDRVHVAIRLFEITHPWIKDGDRVEEKERTPDAELRRLTKTKEVRIIEEEPKQREIERLREVIRVMEEANKASEKERERNERRRESEETAQQDESGEESSSEAAKEPARKPTDKIKKANNAPTMPSVRASTPPRHPSPAPPMFQYPVDGSPHLGYSTPIGPMSGSPPAMNYVSGFNNARIGGEINIGNVTNSDNTKGGSAVPRQRYVSGRRTKSGKVVFK